MSFDMPARRVSSSENLLQTTENYALKVYKIAVDHHISQPPHFIQAHPSHKNRPPRRYRGDGKRIALPRPPQTSAAHFKRPYRKRSGRNIGMLPRFLLRRAPDRTLPFRGRVER